MPLHIVSVSDSRQAATLDADDDDDDDDDYKALKGLIRPLGASYGA